MEDARDSYGGEHGHPSYADAEMLVHAFDIDESDTLDSEGMKLVFIWIGTLLFFFF